MTLRKLPFISAVKLAHIDGQLIIPTTLFYQDRKPIVGRDAIEQCSKPELLIEDFKVELGYNDPDAVSRRSVAAEKSPRRTSVGLAKDFFDEVLKKVGHWLDVQGLATPTRILIAEPLSLSGSELATEAWLANYRKSIRRALPSRFVEVDFMPEPFAVFQYYRYGLRHPIVAEQRKHIALVLDFGGGTFDASVIETTKTGDISQGGVNSRPLGAKSAHVGGFYINRLIAEQLIFSVLDKQRDKSTFRKSLAFFYENKNAGEDFINSLSAPQQALFRNMKRLLSDVERAKIAVCNGIANWHLDATLSGAMAFPIDVPIDPLSTSARTASVRLDAATLKTIFLSQIWQRLKQTIGTTLDRARADLKGQDISVVLLSGGSSNIRWLKPLIERDLRSELSGAQILELNENFQEIVAKGLATECARRFYTSGQGDFRAVTYNRLCLVLRADDGALEIRKLKPLRGAIAERLDDGGDDGVLLPAASSLRGLAGEPLIWKAKLSRAPKRSLDYYFLRSSFDPDDLDALHNVENHRVFTPAGVKFQQGIEIELTVREDGTAEPRFAYGRDNLREGEIVEGRPFYMDMTAVSEESLGETYLGFDFGTSTSACSYVRSSDIQFIDQRARSAEWRELNDLVAELPYPVASPLARYLSETDPERRADRGREAAEAILTLASYICYSEHCVQSAGTSYFKAVQHRSAGPLWALLKNCLRSRPNSYLFGAGLIDLLAPATLSQLDQQINDIAASKHGRVVPVDYVSMLSLLANTLAKSLGDAKLGVFEDVTAKRFARGRFTGIFRSLTGPSQTFIDVLEYDGSEPFTDADVVIVHPEKGTGLNLSPLYFWGLDQTSALASDLFEYDNHRGTIFGFKAVQPREGFAVEESDPSYGEAWSALSEARNRDPKWAYLEGLILTSHRM